METFSDSKGVVARWSEHFQKLLNVPGDIDHDVLDNILQRFFKTSLDDIPIMDDMARTNSGLKDGKAPGGDGIPAEVWKHGGDNMFSRLHQLITNAWEVGSVLKAWKDASIVTIYKKGIIKYILNSISNIMRYTQKHTNTHTQTMSLRIMCSITLQRIHVNEMGL